MSFFVVVRAAADDALRLLDERVYERRGQALDAVREALSAGRLGGDECFVCDLDAAVPIIVAIAPTLVPTIAAEPAVSEPMSVEAESLVSEEPLDEAAPETPEPLPEAPEATPETPEPSREAPVPVIAPADDLAAALRRATASLAAEAPMPEAPAEGAEAADEAEPVAPGLQELADAIEQLQAPADEDEPSAAEPQQEVRVEWPWLVEQPSAAPVVERPAAAPEPVEQPPVEPSSLEPSLIVPLTADPFTMDEGSSFMPRPVVLGEYGEPEPTTASEPVAPASVEPMEPLVPEPSVPAPVAVPEPAAEPVEESPALGGYEGGEDDLSHYTCHDCVYENTCPKAGASAPTECGTFQWKSV